ncbi:MAG: heavy-metal-associated domain-containing protein [Chitinophagaceae bacterium]|nr:MAG: heavy-metal-associated domain-containing protein [Chitinophagaceae bacterium]
MKHTYKVEGMTCGNCVSKVKSEILKHPDVLTAEVSLEKKQAEIEMDKHIQTSDLQKRLSDIGNYTISEKDVDMQHEETETENEDSWFQTYKPILLIFAFVAGVSFLAAYSAGVVDWMLWMQYFMAGFFITFSFFKFLDLKGFAESYSTYDLLAKKIYNYGYVYPFLELGLGIAYLTGVFPLYTYVATIVIMGFSSIGVIQSVLDKQKIQCACLGTVFNLPMSTVTIIEDLLMVAMAAGMLIMVV